MESLSFIMQKIFYSVESQNKKNSVYKIIDFLILLFVFFAIVVFIFLPFVCVLKEAFFKDANFNVEGIFTILKNKSYLVKNSLITGILTAVLTSLASISVALFYFVSGRKTQKLIFIILATTMISPPFVTSLGYINLFGRRGIISYYILKLSINPYGMLGIVLMQVLGGFSLASLILIGFLSNFDSFQIDSARNLGAKTNTIITDIILPNLMPAIRTLTVLSFFRSLSDFGTPAIIGGAFDVMATESYFALIARGDINEAAILNVIILLPAFLIFIFYQKSFKNFSGVSKGLSSSEMKLERKGFLVHFFSAVGIFFLLWISLQYFSIILSAFTRMQKGQLRFSLLNFSDALPYIDGTIFRSIVYSLIAALSVSILGFLVGYYNKIKKIKIYKAVDFISTLPYIIPGTFFGIGYLLAFRNPPFALTGTASIVVLNMIFKQMPFSNNVANATMSEISSDVIDSVRDLGGSTLHEFSDAVFPLSLHGLGVSFINGFTSTMTTLGSIIFLIYPSQKVLTLTMFDLIQSGKYNEGAVLALLIILICLFVNLIYLLVLQKLKK
ncbi:MAG: iron ABC transporter permease [Treponemataceae bacterium]